MTASCVVSLCAATAAVDTAAVALLPPKRVAPVFSLRVHTERLREGPDSFPPRYIHV